MIGWWTAPPRTQPDLTPDGYRYLAIGAGQRVPRPFHLRWLAPKICRTYGRRWVWLTRTSVLLLAPLAWWYTGSPWMAACVLLPGVWFNWRAPVLVDAPAMALALTAACLAPHHPYAAVAVACLAGATRETAPVWAAVWAWNPILLAGLIPVAIRAIQHDGPDVLDERNANIVAHPIRAGLAAHHGMWRTPVMWAPWAGLLLALPALTGGGTVAWVLAVSLLAGYSQLVTATDTVRLYQWAWPAMAAATVAAVPAAWLPLIAATIVFNPYQPEEV